MYKQIFHIYETKWNGFVYMTQNFILFVLKKKKNLYRQLIP